jgi:ATP-binding cassette, subfamily B, bacterial
VLVGQSMRTGNFTLGDFSLFVYLLQSMGDLTTFGGMLWARYKQMNVSVKRMYRLMENAPLDALVEHSKVDLDGDLPEVTYPTKTASDRLSELVADHLTFHYPGSVNGIEDISLQTQTRLADSDHRSHRLWQNDTAPHLLGLLPADSGEIRWNGQVITDPGTSSSRQDAPTPHKSRACSATPCEIIFCSGLNKSDDDIYRATKLAVMDRDLEQLDDNLETMVGARGVKLSGGQAQRTAAARMFIRDTELVVFDDLSSALDVETERQLWERIFEQAMN